MATKKTWFVRGLRDGLPIGLGYFAVSFVLWDFSMVSLIKYQFSASN